MSFDGKYRHQILGSDQGNQHLWEDLIHRKDLRNPQKKLRKKYLNHHHHMTYRFMKDDDIVFDPQYAQWWEKKNHHAWRSYRIWTCGDPAITDQLQQRLYLRSRTQSGIKTWSWYHPRVRNEIRRDCRKFNQCGIDRALGVHDSAYQRSYRIHPKTSEYGSQTIHVGTIA